MGRAGPGLRAWECAGSSIRRVEGGHETAFSPSGRELVALRKDLLFVPLGGGRPRRVGPLVGRIDRRKLPRREEAVRVVYFEGGPVIFAEAGGGGAVEVLRRRYPPGMWGHPRRAEIWAAVILGAAWLWTVRGWLRQNSPAAESTVTPEGSGPTNG